MVLFISQFQIFSALADDLVINESEVRQESLQTETKKRSNEDLIEFLKSYHVKRQVIKILIAQMEQKQVQAEDVLSIFEEERKLSGEVYFQGFLERLGTTSTMRGKLLTLGRSTPRIQRFLDAVKRVVTARQCNLNLGF